MTEQLYRLTLTSPYREKLEMLHEWMMSGEIRTFQLKDGKIHGFLMSLNAELPIGEYDPVVVTLDVRTP